MNTPARIVYGALGGLALLVSAAALLRPELALSSESFTPDAAHLVQEQAAGGVFIGIMALWCCFNVDKRRPVHFALLTFTFLFAAIHWTEFAHGRRLIASPIVNTVPFALLLSITPFRRRP